MHRACAYRGAPNDVVVFACILEAARNTAFWQCLHKIREIREIRGSFLLLKDISLTTELNRYDFRGCMILGSPGRVFIVTAGRNLTCFALQNMLMNCGVI
jgi:hypothetical protein